jgi:hypothetical protein
MKRVLTASALIPFALYAIYWAPQYVFIAIVLLMALLCYREFDGLVAAHGIEHPGCSAPPPESDCSVNPCNSASWR